MSEHQPTYEEGLRDGKITNLEVTVKEHSGRLRAMERIVWGMIAIIGFIEFWPKLKDFLG